MNYLEKGRIRYDQGGFLVTKQGLAPDPDFPNYKVLSRDIQEIENNMSTSQFAVADSLYSVMTGRFSTICTGKEALKTIECIDKVINSIRSI